MWVKFSELLLSCDNKLTIRQIPCFPAFLRMGRTFLLYCLIFKQKFPFKVRSTLKGKNCPRGAGSFPEINWTSCLNHGCTSGPSDLGANSVDL